MHAGDGAAAQQCVLGGALVEIRAMPCMGWTVSCRLFVQFGAAVAWCMRAWGASSAKSPHSTSTAPLGRSWLHHQPKLRQTAGVPFGAVSLSDEGSTVRMVWVCVQPAVGRLIQAALELELYLSQLPGRVHTPHWGWSVPFSWGVRHSMYMVTWAPGASLLAMLVVATEARCLGLRPQGNGWWVRLVLAALTSCSIYLQGSAQPARRCGIPHPSGLLCLACIVVVWFRAASLDLSAGFRAAAERVGAPVAGCAYARAAHCLGLLVLTPFRTGSLLLWHVTALLVCWAIGCGVAPTLPVGSHACRRACRPDGMLHTLAVRLSFLCAPPAWLRLARILYAVLSVSSRLGLVTWYSTAALGG